MTKLFGIFIFTLSFQFLAGSALAVERPFSLTPGLSFTSIAYSQTGMSDFSEIALTAKLSSIFKLSDRWFLNGSIFATAVPISSNLAGITANYLGVNLKISYRFTRPSSPIIFYLAAGGFYSAIFVTRQMFGYEGVIGPQIYPTLGVQLSSKNSLSLSFKFSPVANQIQLLKLSNREQAVGLVFNHVNSSNDHSVGVSLDYSQLIFNFSNSDISNSTVSVCVSYSI